MSELTLQLPDDLLSRVRWKAEHDQIPLDTLVREAIEAYLDEEEQPTKESLLEDLRQSLCDVLVGATRPADEVIEELRQKYQATSRD